MSGRSCQLVRRNSVHTGKLFRLFTRLPLLSRTCAHCTSAAVTASSLPPSLGLPLLSYAYDFIHVKCYVNRGLFSQRIYNYSAAAYFAVVYLALPPVYSCIFFINFINSYNTFETCIILYMYIPYIYIYFIKFYFGKDCG